MAGDTICTRCGHFVPNVHIVREHIRPRFLDRDRHGGFMKVCLDCSMRAAGEQLQEYQALAASRNKEPYQTFLTAMYEIDALLKAPSADKKQLQYLTRILFASVITAMETYLADTFTNRVLNDDALFKKFVETDPVLKDRKANFPSIAAGFSLRAEVQSYLVNDLIFHNVAKIGKMYQSVLRVEFPPDLEQIYTAVATRHDIVHRSGRSPGGVQSSVDVQAVLTLMKSLKTFIKSIEDQL